MQDPPHAPTPSDDSGQYFRLPPLVTGGAILAVLGIALAVGLYANNAVRQHGVPEPTPSPTALPVAVITVSTATPLPAVVQTPTPLIVVLAPATTPTSATLAVSQAPLREPSATPTQVPVPQPGLTKAPSTAPTPTVDPVLADEVGKAYVQFWRVRSQALLELDDSHLGEVMDGQYLTDIEHLIEQLRVEGRAIKTQASLNFNVLQINGSFARLIDHVDDKSVYVKLGTEDAINDPELDNFTVLYTLSKSSTIWKVVDSAISP